MIRSFPGNTDGLKSAALLTKKRNLLYARCELPCRLSTVPTISPISPDYFVRFCISFLPLYYCYIATASYYINSLMKEVLSYRGHSIDLHSKTMGLLLYDTNLRHEIVKMIAEAFKITLSPEAAAKN